MLVKGKHGGRDEGERWGCLGALGLASSLSGSVLGQIPVVQINSGILGRAEP